MHAYSSASSNPHLSQSSSGGQKQAHSQTHTHQPWSPEAVASLPPPGLSGPSQLVFSPAPPEYASSVNLSSGVSSTAGAKTTSSIVRDAKAAPALINNASSHTTSSSTKPKKKRYLAFVSSPSTVIRTSRSPPTIYRPLTTGLLPSHANDSNVGGSRYNSQGHSASSYSQNSNSHASASGVAMGSGSAASSSTSSTQSSATTTPLHTQERTLMCMDLTDPHQPLLPPQPLLRLTRGTATKRGFLETATSSTLSNNSNNSVGSSSTPVAEAERLSLEERLRRERLRLTTSSGSITQFAWTWSRTACESNLGTSRASIKSQAPGTEKNDSSESNRSSQLRVLIPTRGNLYVQDGVLGDSGAGNNKNSNGQGSSWPTAPRCVHDKTSHGAASDAQLSPDGSMVAWTSEGEIYVQSCDGPSGGLPLQITFGAVQSTEEFIRHGVADFVAQEEMDRYRGFWWHPDSTGILLTRVDESNVPPYRILHHDSGSNDHDTDPYRRPQSSAIPYEDHRYPFAGKTNPTVQLAFVRINRDLVMMPSQNSKTDAGLASSSAFGLKTFSEDEDDGMDMEIARHTSPTIHEMTRKNWAHAVWFDSPREASEYLARVHWLPDGSVATQWQNRAQNVAVISRLDLDRGKTRTLLVERSDAWINLHHMFRVLPRPLHPDECVTTEKHIPPMPNPLPSGSFSFLYASERTGFQHLYLYTFAPGINGDRAIPLRAVSSGEWMVESIVGIDMEKDAVYFTGTFDSVLERHLYALPLASRRLLTQDVASSSSEEGQALGSSNGVRRGLSKVMHALSGKAGGRNGRVQEAIWMSMRPLRLTIESGMHSIIMDDDCELFVDTSSDLDRPTSSRIFELPPDLWNSTSQISLKLVYTLFDAMQDDNSMNSFGGNNSPLVDGLPNGAKLLASLPPPELISFPSSDGAEILHAALYRPNPRVFGPGPYPLVCAVYGGPHVQRVNRSWAQCADMRAQRLRSLGFCVVKCDNRGSSRRGMAFEAAIARRLGRLEVLDQVAVVRQLILRGIVDATRVGVYGWSYGGYLASMCLCRAPDVFSCAVAGAPVTSWDGYDTHYTERYMGHPSENHAGYRESAVFDHVPNMRGKLMIVHGLLDENVHFRHTARLINKLVASGKDYDLMIFPEERHSPRRLRDRIYMEQRISDFFLRHLRHHSQSSTAVDFGSNGTHGGLRGLAGHL